MSATPSRYTIAQIAQALNVTKQAVQKRCNAEKWPSEQAGRGRSFAPSHLPADIRTALAAHLLTTISPSTADLPAAVAGTTPPALPAVATAPTGLFIPTRCADLTDAQRAERDARTGVLASLRRLQVTTSCSQEAAMITLLTNARAGKLDAHQDRALRLARDPRGRSGDGYPSVRTLKRWLKSPDLAPKTVQKDMAVPPWAKVFLGCYQQPQKPSVEAAYREACNVWTAAERPSIHRVRRFLGKLGEVTREMGRMGPRELKNIQPFIRRDFSHLEPNDIWTADGHTFDAEVQHPLHGRPFRPEVTPILDIATRRCVGWSIDLAESGTAVADAMRYACERVGIPAIFYVDNGPGYKNKALSDEATGLMDRIGTDIKHSLPYNSQARGVIERAHQTIFVQAAKQLPSYVGAAMDREARLAQFKLTRKALKSGGSMPLIPWEVFVAFIDERVSDYNARPHRSLKGTSPDLAWRAFEARGWQAQTLAAGDVETLFRPRVSRTIQRGEINLFTNIYFSADLTEFNGLEAHVAYDIHDPSHVWVYTPEGRLICTAEANGNRRHYMPVPVVQQAREKRAQGRLKRVDAKRSEILEELHGAPAIAAQSGRSSSSGGQIVIGSRIIDADAVQALAAESAAENCKTSESTVPRSRSERPMRENLDEWLALDARLQAGEAVSEDEAFWHASFQKHPALKAELKRLAGDAPAEGRRAVG